MTPGPFQRTHQKVPGRPLRSVIIVQTYIPTYRVPFFEELRCSLAGRRIELRVVTSRPAREQAARDDAAHLDWADQVIGREVKVAGRRLILATSARYWSHSDAVIAMQQGTSLDTNHALVSMKMRGIRVGLWGHVKPYTSAGNRLDLWVERRQLHRADHVFAYTDGGAEYAIEAGVEPARVTSVQNTVDTSELGAARRSLTAADIRRFQADQGVASNKTLAFIGGLDRPKRIELLVDVLDRVWACDPSIRLLVGGTGEQEALLAPSVERGQTILLGRVGARQKALMAASSVAIVMPGRIGLVALDALVLGKAILTTEWPYHAPEAEYLTVGESKFVSADTPSDFTELVLRATGQEWATQYASSNVWNYPKMDRMVGNFADGIERMLD